MDKALGLLMLTENTIRLAPGPGIPEQKPRNDQRDEGDEEARIAGILWNFVQTRRGNPSSGR